MSYLHGNRWNINMLIFKSWIIPCGGLLDQIDVISANGRKIIEIAEIFACCINSQGQPSLITAKIAKNFHKLAYTLVKLTVFQFGDPPP